MTESNALVVAGIKSYDLTTLTLTRSKAQGMTQLLATYLAYRYNSRRGYAHPSQATIAEHLKRSERGIRMLVSELGTLGEWHIVSGRGGAVSTGTTWASSRYYPTLEWVQSIVNDLHNEGDEETFMMRLVNNARVLEILPGGLAQQTDIQLTIPGTPVSVQTDAGEDEFLTSLESAMTDDERNSYRESRPSDRLQARSEAQTLINDGYDLLMTVRQAKARARVRPTRWEGGYARWLWNFAYTMPVRQGAVSTVWDGDSNTNWGDGS